MSKKRKLVYKDVRFLFFSILLPLCSFAFLLVLSGFVRHLGQKKRSLTPPTYLKGNFPGIEHTGDLQLISSEVEQKDGKRSKRGQRGQRRVEQVENYET